MFRTLPLLVVIILTACHWIAPLEAGPFPKEKATVALSMLSALSERKFDSAAVYFHSSVQTEFSSQELQSKWESLESNLGKFIEVKGLSMDTASSFEGDEVLTVVVRCQFRKGEALLGVRVDDEFKVLSLIFPVKPK